MFAGDMPELVKTDRRQVDHAGDTKKTEGKPNRNRHCRLTRDSPELR